MKGEASAESKVSRLADIPTPWAGIGDTPLWGRLETIEGGPRGTFSCAPLAHHMGQHPTPGPSSVGGPLAVPAQHQRPLYLDSCALCGLMEYRGTWLLRQRLPHPYIWEEGYLVYVFIIAQICSVDNTVGPPHFQQNAVCSSLPENPSWPVKL